MNRRNFFQRFAVLAAAAVAAPLMVPPGPKLLARGPIFPFKYLKDKRTVALNPEWKNAQYEIRIMISEGDCGTERLIEDPWPPRFNYVEDANIYLERFKSYPLRRA